MRIERLKIKEFRNLKDFEIRFTPAVPESDYANGKPREFKSHVVIGQNDSPNCCARIRANTKGAMLLLAKERTFQLVSKWLGSQVYDRLCGSKGITGYP